MAKRYNKKGGKKKGGKKTKKSRAKARGHRLVRYNRLAKKIGKRAAHAEVYGKGKHSKKGKKKGRKAAKGRKGKHGRKVGYCSIGKCARRPILGGAKGMATHKRKHHRG